MGTIAGSGRLAAFQNQIFPNGLDLGRCQINMAPGVWRADPATTFLQGQLVMLDATTEYLKLATGAAGTLVLGFAKWNKATTLYAVSVDEPITLTGTSAIPLKHPSVSNVLVRSAAGTGTVYTVTTDYTVNATNGTVTRVGGGTITDGQTVYVTYTYQLLSTDIEFQGRNFWNQLDDVSVADGFTAVITGADLIFSSQFDSSLQYTIGDTLYASTGKPGFVTNSTETGANTIKIGTVFQVPGATDPFLGIKPKYGNMTL